MKDEWVKEKRRRTIAEGINKERDAERGIKEKTSVRKMDEHEGVENEEAMG